MQSLRRQFVGNTIIYTISQVLAKISNLILLPVFARLIGTEGYGIYTQIIVSFTLLVPFISFRLETAAVRFLSGESDSLRFRQGFYSALVWILVGGMAMWALLALAANLSAEILFGDPSYADFMPISGLLFLIIILRNYLNGYLRIIHRMNLLSAILLIQVFSETALIVLAVVLGYGVKGAIFALIIARLISSVLHLIFIIRHTGRPAFGWPILREMLGYSIPLMPNSLAQWFVNYGDRLIITAFLGLASVGIYSAAYSLASLLGMIFSPVGFVMFPLLSRLWDRGEKTEVNRYFTYITRYYLMFSLPACVGLALVSQQIIALVATEAFLTDRLLVFWIALGIVLSDLYQINVYVFHLVRKTRYITVMLFAGALLNLGLNIVLVPVMGISGSAFATAATFALICVFSIIYGQREMGYHMNWPDIGKGAMAAAIMGGVLLLLPVDSLLMVVVVALLGAVIYGTLLIVFGVVSRAEINVFTRLLSNARLN